MSRLSRIALLLPLVVALPGCRTIGRMFEGVNSDLAHGGDYCRVPRETPDGEIDVTDSDWATIPGRFR